MLKKKRQFPRIDSMLVSNFFAFHFAYLSIKQLYSESCVVFMKCNNGKCVTFLGANGISGDGFGMGGIGGLIIEDHFSGCSKVTLLRDPFKGLLKFKFQRFSNESFSIPGHHQNPTKCQK